MNDKIDHIWHVWINRRNPLFNDDKPCQWCGKMIDEHGPPGKAQMATSRRDRLCPVEGVSSQFYTPKLELPSVTEPPMGSMYSWKSALQTLAWAPKMLKKAFTGTLDTQHQQCSRCKPVPVENNELRCWLGQDVTKCPILLDLQACLKEQTTKPLPSGQPSYYASVTEDDIYEVMGAVCVWHLLASDWSQDRKELPAPAFVDWNEGAFSDASDRMFWENVYTSMAQGMAEDYPPDREDEPQDQP